MSRSRARQHPNGYGRRMLLRALTNFYTEHGRMPTRKELLYDGFTDRAIYINLRGLEREGKVRILPVGTVRAVFVERGQRQ